MFMASQHREAMTGHIATAANFGVNPGEGAGKVDWGALKVKRDAYIKGLNNSYETNWKKAGIEVLMGVASFADKGSVKVVLNDGGETILTAKHILIACGGEPTMPDIPGKEFMINSDSFFDLVEQPKKVAILGAGYIAVEMAGIFNGLGSEAHLYFRGETVIRRGFDPFIVKSLMEELKAHGPELHSLTTPTSVTKEADGTLTLVTSTGTEKGFDCIMSGIGRKPVTYTLNLEATGGIELDRGYIKVDEYENTNVAGIYCLGDASTSGYQLTPVALAAGRRLADRLFGGEPKARIDYHTIATVVFSHPPIGTIGLPEPEAIKQYGAENITTRQTRFSSMAYAFNDETSKVKTGLKLVLKGPEELVVGLHCIGPCSDEMLQGFAVAVRMGATRRDFEASVAIHPTIGEEMVTFGGWGQKTVDGETKVQLPPYIEP